MLKKLSEKYMEFYGNYKEISGNYIGMEKDRTTNKNQEEMKNAMSEIKNALDGIKSRVGETEDQTSNLEDMVAENTQSEQQKEKEFWTKKYGPNERIDQSSRKNTTKQQRDSQPIRCIVQNSGNQDAHRNG